MTLPSFMVKFEPTLDRGSYGIRANCQLDGSFAWGIWCSIPGIPHSHRVRTDLRIGFFGAHPMHTAADEHTRQPGRPSLAPRSCCQGWSHPVGDIWRSGCQVGPLSFPFRSSNLLQYIYMYIYIYIAIGLIYTEAVGCIGHILDTPWSSPNISQPDPLELIFQCHWPASSNAT